MAVNESRSMNRDLRLGANEGAHKSLTPNRGGEVDPTHPTLRFNELQVQYGIEKSPFADAPQPHLH